MAAPPDGTFLFLGWLTVLVINTKVRLTNAAFVAITLKGRVRGLPADCLALLGTPLLGEVHIDILTTAPRELRPHALAAKICRVWRHTELLLIIFELINDCLC